MSESEYKEYQLQMGIEDKEEWIPIPNCIPRVDITEDDNYVLFFEEE